MDQVTAASYAHILGGEHYDLHQERVRKPSPESDLREHLICAETWFTYAMMNQGRITLVRSDQVGLRTDVAHFMPTCELQLAIETSYPDAPGRSTPTMSSYVGRPNFFLIPGTGTESEFDRFAKAHGGNLEQYVTHNLAMYRDAKEIGALALSSLKLTAVRCPTKATSTLAKPSVLQSHDATPLQASDGSPAATLCARISNESQIRSIDDVKTAVPVKEHTYIMTGQVQFAIHSSGKVIDVRRQVMQSVVDWLTEKGINVPREWSDQSSWEAGHIMSTTQVWVDADDQRLALRMNEPCKTQPGRFWRSEIVMIEHASHLHLAFRQGAMVQEGVSPYTHFHLPAWVPALADRFGIVLDGQVQSGLPKRLSTRQEISQLQKLIYNVKRKASVIVAVVGNTRSPAGELTLNLARRLAGLTHVFSVPPSAVTQMRQDMAETGFIPDDGLRIYSRHVDDDSAYTSSPMVRGLGASTDQLIERLTEVSAVDSTVIRDHDSEIPSYSLVRAMIQRDRQLQQQEVMASLPARSEVDQLRDERSRLQADVQAAQELAEEVQGNLNHARDELTRKGALLSSKDDELAFLRKRIAELEAASLSTFAAPTTWEGLAEWANVQFVGRLVITDSAVRASRDAPFEDKRLVAEVLALLAGPYWAIRAAGEDRAIPLLEAESARLHVEVCKVGSAIRNHRYADQYRCTWKGRSFLLDQHVSGSSSRDPRYGFRLYFTWDDQTNQVIVGAYPEHKENTWR